MTATSPQGQQGESAATPGPWLRDGLTVYFLDWDGEWRGSDNRPLLTNRFSLHLQGSPQRIPLAELEANAKLIAAAPDLLAVVRDTAFHFAGTDSPLGQRAIAALVKVGIKL